MSAPILLAPMHVTESEMYCGECHAAVGNRSGGARRRSCNAVNRSRSSIGPLHRGHDQVVRVSQSSAVVFLIGFATAAPSSRKHTGRSVERLRVLRKPKWRMRTKPCGSTCSKNRRKNSLT